MTDTVGRMRHLDVVVANRPVSTRVPLAATTADRLDGNWAVYARSMILLVQALAAQHDGPTAAGRC